MLDPMAEAIAQLGTRQTILICGHDGLDEVSLSAATAVRIVQGEIVSISEWWPQELGLEPCDIEELKADGPTQSAKIIRAVLNDEEGPAKRIVLANAAAALYAAERVEGMRDGVALARETLKSGRAARVLENLIAAGK